MADIIHVAIASDDRYFPGLLATLTSIIVNTKTQDDILFHVIDGGIKQKSWEFLEITLQRFSKVGVKRYCISQTHFEGFPKFFYDSKMAYARLLLPNLLSEKKVIYVDSDILFLKDIGLLWETKFENKAAMVALEACMPQLKDDYPIVEDLNLDREAPYFNSGLMYLDLERFRNEKISVRTMQYLQQHPNSCKLHDQSALNVTLYDNFKLLDQSWNTQSHRAIFKLENRFDDFFNYAINFHFVTSFKPWLHYNGSLPNRLFYALLEEIGYKLTDNSFLDSKKNYIKKLHIGRFLPLLYYLRSFRKKVSGQQIQAESDVKVAKYWQEQLSIIKFHHKKYLRINDMEAEWRKKIKQALNSNIINA